MEQELELELSTGEFIAIKIDLLNPPGHSAMMTDVIKKEELGGQLYYHQVPTQTNSSALMAFKEVLARAESKCAHIDEKITLVAVNNPHGCPLLSIDEQWRLLGENIPITNAGMK